MSDMLMAACEARQIPCLDATEALRSEARRGVLPFLPLDTHLSAQGHAAFSEAVAPFIEVLFDGLSHPPAAPDASVPMP